MSGTPKPKSERTLTINLENIALNTSEEQQKEEEDERKEVDEEDEEKIPGLGRWALNAPGSCCPAARSSMQLAAFGVSTIFPKMSSES